MHTKKVISSGIKIEVAKKALIMIHGRGGSAEDIISLASHLELDEFTILAPQATNNTWYPYSFMAPPAQNEPWLSSALSLLQEIVEEVIAEGIPRDGVYLLGFSQGACLTLEFSARNADKYGGIIAFTGGLIGDKINPSNYKGDFGGTPIFIGSSNPDPHIPVERVYASANILRDMNASVTDKIYNNMGHTIIEDEIVEAGKVLSAETKK